jgi:hypothetical protein
MRDVSKGTRSALMKILLRLCESVDRFAAPQYEAFVAICYRIAGHVGLLPPNSAKEVRTEGTPYAWPYGVFFVRFRAKEMEL